MNFTLMYSPRYMRWRILANDLYGRGKPELNIYVSLVSVMLNIILNILWIPKFGIAGAASATSARQSKCGRSRQKTSFMHVTSKKKKRGETIS